MGEKVRILGIAPYKGLVTLMKRYAGQRDDIQLTAMLGNVETGLSLAKEHYRNYDIIISRANTASRIAKGVPIPVIDIGIDYYDVLLCLKTAENTKTKFAVLGFRSLTTIAKSICNVLKIPTDIFSINTTSEANSLLDKLKEQGYKTVICDTVPYNYAKLIGITPILLTSSMESLKAAVDQAVYTWQTHRDLYHSLSLMHQLLDSSANRFLVLSRTGECIYTTLEDEIAVPIQAKLQNELEQCCTGRKRSFFITVNNQMYSITSHLVDETLSPYIIFHIMRSEIPLAYSKYGVTIMDKQSAQERTGWLISTMQRAPCVTTRSTSSTALLSAIKAGTSSPNIITRPLRTTEIPSTFPTWTHCKSPSRSSCSPSYWTPTCMCATI